MYDGMINVYKEKGYTSHDVVARLRGILHQKKIGHTGTLDPDAEGVLPVCLGKGTRLCELITDYDKTYRAVLLLGLVTDTQDISGRILEEQTPDLTEAAVREAVLSFVGSYDQIPPMYSAIKIGGKKLYELAREGKEIERRPRHVQILDISIQEIDLPRVTMEVTCSKGTYIRTLCHDIGRRLGCGGCMESLVRTRTGRFALSGALKLSEIEALAAEGEDALRQQIIPPEVMLADHPALIVRDGAADKLLKNGNKLPADALLPYEAVSGAEVSAIEEDSEEEDSGMAKDGRQDESRLAFTDGARYRIFDIDGIFTGLYSYQAGHQLFKSEKMFLDR